MSRCPPTSGPAERYRRWLAVRRGSIRAVIGTRAAAYAPVADLGLLAIWDDGDDLHDEPRAPYANTRDVLVLRSAQTGAALLVGGYARTPEAQQLVASGWAHEIVADRAGAAGRRATHRRVGRRRRAGARSGGRRRPAAEPGLAHDARRARRRASGARAGAAPRVRPVAGLRARPHSGALPGVLRAARVRRRRAPSRPAGGAGGRRGTGAAPACDGRELRVGRRRRPAHRRGTRSRVSGRNSPHQRRRARARHRA